jgi:WD40 repeat protein
MFDDPVVIVLDALTGAIVRTFSGHTNGVETLAFSPDGRWLVSGGRDQSIRVWDVGDLSK